MPSTKQISRLIGMLMMRIPKRSAETIARVRAGLCLLCEARHTKRGLCEKHYLEFRRRQDELPLRQRAKFEMDAIRACKILAAGEIRRLKRDDPFAGL